MNNTTINGYTVHNFNYNHMNEITVGHMREMVDNLWDGDYITVSFYENETRCDLMVNYKLGKMRVHLAYYDGNDNKLSEYNLIHEGCTLADIGWMLDYAVID